MAVVNTSINVAAGNMVMETIPYVGAGGMDTVNTPIPRAEVNFQINDVDIPVATGGDTQRVLIKCVLPLSFAYVVQEISVYSLYGVDAADWGATPTCRIRNTAIGGRTWAHSMDLWSRGVHSASPITIKSRSYHLSCPGELNRLVIPGTDANLDINLVNDTADGTAMTIDGFLARFLQFDINQAYFFGANTPIPVR